jgi:hypothetical protein
LVATCLSARTGDSKPPGLYLVATAAMSAAALAMIQMRLARQVREKWAETSA